MVPRALITGITGQDGSYLAEFLLGKGYSVTGIVRRSSTFGTERIEHLRDRLTLVYGDMTDAGCLRSVVSRVQPDEVYNLAAQSHVKVSFEIPEYTADSDALGALRLIEAVREHAPRARFYQASTSEMFGASPAPQNEDTPFLPRSPYAAAKLYAHHVVGNYRDAYGLHASCGILFNHESPRRPPTFVTRKITQAAARIKAGLQDTVTLGNLDARRDWGFAGDYVKSMWLMLQQDTPGDYVVATGTSWSVREWAESVFFAAGLDLSKHLVVDEQYERPTEVPDLCGDATRAREALGWAPEVSAGELMAMMLEHDLRTTKGAA